MKVLLLTLLLFATTNGRQKLSPEEYYTYMFTEPEESVKFRRPGVIVDIPGLGTVNGTEGITVPPEAKTMYSFFGIPYGQDTSGSNRFKPSKAALPWEGVLDVTTAKPEDSCPHNGMVIGFKGTEDCLKLYVFTPMLPDDENFVEAMPVLVYIHGGKFIDGDFNIYRGNRLIDAADIVVVTLHYRLGVLGFMSTQTEDAPGNSGLYDMVLALEWIQQYISAFGGDPTKVVISGESAGAASVSHLMMYEHAEGLFRGVIAQSGTALDAWAIDITPVESALRYGTYHNCNYTVEEIPEFLACMRDVPYEDLIGKWNGFAAQQQYEGKLGFSGATPVVQLAGEPKIISEDPIIKLREGRFYNVPIFFGNNKHEGSFVLGMIYRGYIGPHEVENDPEFWRNDAFYLILNVDYKDDVTGMLERTFVKDYFNNTYPLDIIEANPGCIDMLGAMFFKASVHTVAETVAQYGGTAYVYSFEYADGWSNFEMFFGSAAPIYGGVTHSDELMYIYTLWPPVTVRNRIVSERMTKIWTNFVKHLHPTAEGSKEYKLPSLQPYTGDNREYLEINLEVTTKPDYLVTWRPCTGPLGNENTCPVEE